MPGLTLQQLQTMGAAPVKKNGLTLQQLQTMGATTVSSQTSSSITGNESPLQAGINATKNTPSSAFNFAKNSVLGLNPMNTINTISQIPGAFSDLVKQKGSVWGAVTSALGEVPSETVKTATNMVPKGVRQAVVGDFQGASKTFQEDPFGQAAPVVLATIGAAKLADKALGTTKFSSAVDTGIQKIASPVTKGAEVAYNTVKTMTRSITSKVIGLSDPKTITTIMKDPTSVKQMVAENNARGGVANEFGNAIDSVENKLNDTGAAYNPIRKAATPVVPPENFLQKGLDQFGLKLKDGQVTADTKSITRNASDIKAVQGFVDNWGEKLATGMDSNEFMNMRSDLADLAKYDKLTGMGKTSASQVIAEGLRSSANDAMRPQIPGLQVLDNAYTELAPQFKQIRKDFLTVDPMTKEYVLKDGALNKIANAANKPQLITRMEEVMPGITKRLEVLKAAEDIKGAFGTKIGTYTRSGLEIGSVVTGNIPLAVATILSHPAIAIPLIRGFGFTSAQIGTIVNTLTAVADKSIQSPINQAYLTVGNSLKQSQQKLK